MRWMYIAIIFLLRAQLEAEGQEYEEEYIEEYMEVTTFTEVLYPVLSTVYCEYIILNYHNKNCLVSGCATFNYMALSDDTKY